MRRTESETKSFLVEREVLLARENRNREPVLRGWERAHIGIAVCAVRVVGEVEVDDVLVGWAFLDVEVPRSAIRLLARCGVPERQEEALGLVVMTRLRHGLVRREPLLFPINPELEDAMADHFARDALRGYEDDPLRVRVLDQPRWHSVLWIDGEVGESREFPAEGVRNRRLGILFEKIVLFPPHRLDALHVFVGAMGHGLPTAFGSDKFVRLTSSRGSL